MGKKSIFLGVFTLFCFEMAANPMEGCSGCTHVTSHQVCSLDEPFERKETPCYYIGSIEEAAPPPPGLHFEPKFESFDDIEFK